MKLVDTNVMAYLLIAGDRTDQAQALWRVDPDWRSEAFCRIEFSNLLFRNFLSRFRKYELRVERVKGKSEFGMRHAYSLC